MNAFMHIRHATCRLSTGGRVFLIDPMLSEVGALPPVGFTANQRRNPIVALPIAPEEVVAGIDAVIVTHTHFDHFDEAARRLVPAATPILCRASDAARLRSWAFEDVRASADGRFEFGDVRIRFDDGPHAWGLLRALAGSSASVLIEHEGESTLFSGDRRCEDDLLKLLAAHPTRFVVNAGSARFRAGSPITWTSDEVRRVAERHPQVEVHAVHLDAINHCVESASETRERLADLPNVVVHPELSHRAHERMV